MGIGEMPDAAAYGDAGSDTLGNIARAAAAQPAESARTRAGEYQRAFEDLPPVSDPSAAYGRCALASPGKDTTTGHWEMAGIHLEKPFPVYPECFPAEIMSDSNGGSVERRSGTARLRERRSFNGSATSMCARARRSSTRRQTAFFRSPRMKR